MVARSGRLGIETRLAAAARELISGEAPGLTPGLDEMVSICISPDMRLAEQSDLEQVGAFLSALGGPLFRERFPSRTADDFYRWKYFENPLGEAIVGIATAGNKIVSLVAATPKRLLVEGKPVAAYELGDFLTGEDYRKKGLFSELIELVCGSISDRGGALAYVQPNNTSFPILTEKLSFYEGQRIDSRRFLSPSHAISRMSRIPRSFLRLSGIDSLFQKTFIPQNSSGAVEVYSVERFGEEIDRLWEQAAKRYRFLLVRDSVYLNWRFSDCPTPYKLWLARRDNQVVGYLVTHAHQSIPIALIVDLFSDSSDLETAQALVATGMRTLLKEGARSIIAWTLPASDQSAGRRVLRRACPFRRKGYLHLAFRILRSQDLTLPLPPEGWHFTAGDSDGV